MLRRLLTSLWYVSASLLVLAALVLSLARLALPMLEVRESQLAAWMRDAIGHDVLIGDLHLVWRGWGPELRVVNVQLSDPATQRVVLTAQELRVGVDLWDSLWQWRPEPSRVVLIGSELSLQRAADGRLSVEGIDLRGDTTNPWATALAQPRVEFRALRVHWRDATGAWPDAILDDVDLRLLNRGSRHQLQLYLRLPAALGDELNLAADLRGPVERFEAWSGEVYVDIAGANLQQWVTAPLPGGLAGSGRLDARLWADVREGRAEHVIGQVAIDGPRLAEVGGAAEIDADADAATADAAKTTVETKTAVEPETVLEGATVPETKRTVAPVEASAAPPLFSAQRVAGQIEWQRAKQGWTFHLDRIQLTDQEDLWRESGLTVAVSEPLAGVQQVQLGLTYLRLETVAPWLAHVMKAAPERHDLLRQMQLGGAVQALQLAFNAQAGRIRELAYQLRFDDLHSSPVDRLPGSAGLSGRLIGTHEHGLLELDSAAAQIELPTLFREPLSLDRLQGRLYWRRYADRLRISSAGLTAANADIATDSRLRLEIPFDGGKPFLDLQTAFTSGRVADAYKYLPVGIMPPRTVSWLDSALISGQVDSGAVLFHGRFGEFPFDRATGRMEVRANVSDGVLDYHPDWHRIEDLDAELIFSNRSMRIRGHSGKILGTELRDVDVRIDNLAHARLQIDGQVRGALADMLRYVQESPLNQDADTTLGQVQAEGEADLELQVDMPLADSAPTAVNGRLTLTDNRLSLPSWDLHFEHLQGAVEFTDKQINAKQLQAELMQVPVQMKVATVTHSERRMTRIQARGALPLVARLHATDAPFWKRVQGESNWTAVAYLPQGEGRPTAPVLELHSQLDGIGVDLPAPFGKSATGTRNFELQARLRAGDEFPLQIVYGEHSAAVQLHKTSAGYRLERGAVQLGDTAAALPDEPGLTIAGHLANFPLDEWRALRGAQSGAVDATALAGPLRSLRVAVTDLRAFGRAFNQVQVNAQRGTAAWELNLGGPDMQGLVRLPDASDAPVAGQLARLHIPKAADESATSSLDPADLPPLQLAIDSLRFHDLELGHVNLQTRPLADGVTVERLQVEADWLKMQAHGTWRRHGGADASRFKIELQGGELGRLLSTFGYAGSVEGGPTFGEVEANWPGTPADFALAKLEGSLALRIGPGRLLNVETGAGRVFGLFNMQGIRRRLALDFSDVFAKGFSFDRIEGNFTLLDTDAYTNDLVIEGPAARIEISGRTGLAKHDYDQLVTVYPRVQSTLPIAGAIAGGPVVGAALLLVDRLFADQMEDLTRFARYQYSVTGSWDDPQFQQIDKKAAQGLQNKSPTGTDKQ